MRTESAWSTIGSGGNVTVSRCLARSMSGILVSTAMRTTSSSWIRSGAASILPRVMRETSSRSSTSRTM